MNKQPIIKYSEYMTLKVLVKKGKINLNLGDYDSMSVEGLTKTGITTLTYHKQQPKYLILTTKGKIFLNKLFKHSRYPKNYNHLMFETGIACAILAINFEILNISIILNVSYSFNTEYFSIIAIIPIALTMLWIVKHHFLINYPIITRKQFKNRIIKTKGINWDEDLNDLFTIQQVKD